MRLGRLPHDPDTVAFAPQHRMAAASPVPAKLVRAHIPFAPGLYDNDTLPDCTAAGLANAASAFGLVRSGAPPVIDPASVPRVYAACVDNPPDLAASNGAVMQDVLQRAEAGGVDFGQQVPLLPTHAACDARSREQLAHVMLIYGAGYWGLDLTERDMAQMGRPLLDDDGSDRSDVVGGHCVVGWAYDGLGDDDRVQIATWGRLQAVTWRWLGLRLHEAWAVSWPQLVGPSA